MTSVKTDYNGFLRCEGHDIVDADGKRFYPIGFGLGGAIYPEGYMWQMFGGPENNQKACEGPTYMYNKIEELVGEQAAGYFWNCYLENWVSEEDIRNMSAWGANHVRLPLTCKKLCHADGSWDEEGFAEVNKFVQWCRENDLYVVLDLHVAPGGQNPWHICDALGEAKLWTQPDIYWPQTIRIWQEIARRYKEDPIIMGYDLLNEPVLPDGHGIGELWELQNKITQAIREIDVKHIVFIEGDKFARVFTEAEPFDGNMAYSYHLYKYDGPAPTKEDIQFLLDLRNRTGVPLWNGETGDNNAAWWAEDIALHKKHNLGICMWTHKKIVTPNQPYVAEIVPGFQDIAEYVAGRGEAVECERAKEILRKQAEAMKSSACRFQPEFLEGFGWSKKKLGYLDPELSVDKRVADLLEKMTLEEKASQLGNSCDGIERLQLPAFRDGEVEHGVSVIGTDDPQVGAATVFPQAIAMAASFDKELVKECAAAISDEVRAKYNEGFMGLAFCSPVIDLIKDPRWGRAQESFGEDPLLAAVLGAAFVKGLSGDDPKYLKCVAGPKHITANSCEETRRGGNAQVDQRSFWEYYIKPFEKSYELYPYQTIMPAYNGINGMPGAANKWLLRDVLRDMIGFNGYVLSDGQAVYDIYREHHMVSSMEEAVAISILAGCDVANGKGHKEYAVTAVEKGLLPEYAVNEAVTHALKARFQLGLLDPEENRPYMDITGDVVNCRKHRELARRIAAESIVLLKNDGVLPLKKRKIKVALVGNYANNSYLGTYSGIPTEVITVEKGLQQLLGEEGELYTMPLLEAGFAPALVGRRYLRTQEGMPGLKAEYFESRHLLGEPVQTDTIPDINFDWRFGSPIHGMESESAWGVRITGMLTVPETRGYTFYVNSDNGVRLKIAGRTLIDSWGHAAPRTLCAYMELSKDKPVDILLERFAQGEGCRVALGWDYIDAGIYAQAMHHIEQADYVVACLGTDKAIEDETTDRQDIALPKHSEKFLQDVYNQNKNTIAVFFSGGPITCTWADRNLPAVLQAWYFGERGGEALAQILFGMECPAGRMPVTVYTDKQELPDMTEYDLARNEMTYLYYKRKPLYPFGHGLSYTEFSYSGFASKKAFYKEGEILQFKLEVCNIGERDADEVVQLYAKALEASVPMPRRQLVGFERVHIPAGEGREVYFSFPIRDLYRYEEANGGKVLETGRYQFMAGASCEDIRTSLIVKCG